ncbi:YjhT family mutarotase [Brucella sp. 10RB9214]|uniref:N-acetylneuraminate epimerase n=1 Tax=unclassified Brucella TaxID=2632610 RepID=UPI000972CA0B|nr:MULTISPECIES: N-acetylneuraminate epimerase [unclassified Brucella]APY15966.1 N-acetylneuraminic acid mutarotase [Brucella sp. 09RB8910]MRN47248.1 YjhT family mutarotase [Brucella sp. 10RB9212]MRN50098.1 YjhT family mutarotase [Brucella sp. 10RB9214]
MFSLIGAKRLAIGIAALALSTGAVMASEHWPDLPVGIKNGAAARIGNMAYVGLGSAGTDFYALDLNNPSKGWVKRANFIGPATNGAAMAAAGGKIFAFSGNGKATPDAKSAIIFDTAYVYDPGSDGWSKLDTQTPVGLSGAKAVGLADGRIAIFGGYNKELFDKYLADVGAIDKDKEPEAYRKLVVSYMGMKPEAYRWNDEVLVYNPAGNNWGSLGANPFLPNCDPAMAAMGEGDFLLVSGEIKPGLRTPEAKLVKIRDGAAHWQKVSDLPPLSGSEPQEGVAGAYAGKAGDDVLVAGGANFKGAQANAAAGKWFAHDGLAKSWRDDVYAFDGKGWKVAGKLPRGLAYGAAFDAPGGLLIVGGEDGDGKARKEVFLLKWDGKALSVEN